MIASLSELVAPLSDAEFLGLLRERRLTHLKSAHRERLQALIDWDTITHVIATDTYSPKLLRITRDTDIVPAVFYSDGGTPSLPKLNRLLTDGASLLCAHINRHVPHLLTLTDAMRAQLHERVDISAVVTTGSSGALKPHYDRQDVLVVQLDGTKRWLVHDAPVAYPVAGMRHLERPDAPVIFDQWLTPGDLLLVPGGYWHHCENGGRRSLHAAFVIEPLTTQHVMARLIQGWTAEESFRRPVMRAGDGQDLASVEAALKARLVERIGQLSLGDLRDAHSRRHPEYPGSEEAAPDDY